MTNNDIFKKLRVALQLRDDQIVEILQLVDFRISKTELGAFFRSQDHPNYMECGDQVLRNFLNALVIHLRGTKEEPKNPMEVIKGHKADKSNVSSKENQPTNREEKPKSKGFKPTYKLNPKKTAPKIEIIEKVKFNNGKNKKS